MKHDRGDKRMPARWAVWPAEKKRTVLLSSPEHAASFLCKSSELGGCSTWAAGVLFTGFKRLLSSTQTCCIGACYEPPTPKRIDGLVNLARCGQSRVSRAPLSVKEHARPLWICGGNWDGPVDLFWELRIMFPYLLQWVWTSEVRSSQARRQLHTPLRHRLCIHDPKRREGDDGFLTRAIP